MLSVARYGLSKTQWSEIHAYKLLVDSKKIGFTVQYTMQKRWISSATLCAYKKDYNNKQTNK